MIPGGLRLVLVNEEDASMRSRLRAISLALALVIVTPTVALAGSVWDPNDPGYGLDIRWVGVYVQADGRMRVTMSFHTPVRLRWFNLENDWKRVYVGFTDRPIPPYYWVGFFRKRSGGLFAQLCEGGSGCTGIVRVRRPDRFTIRARVDLFPSWGPNVGWSFRGITTKARPEPPRHRPLVIDRTVWGTVT
jgi:hypothetical protein